jgi:hypothetical protein
MKARVLKSLLLILSCFTAAFQVSTAQQIIVNTKGERVVVFPDGSWRAYEPGDSLLLKQQLQKEQVYSAEERPATYEDITDNPGEVLGTMDLAAKYADLTLRQSRDANRKLAAAQDAKFETEGQLQQARENLTIIEPDKIEDLQDELAARELEVKEAEKHQKRATKFAEEAQSILRMSSTKQVTALDKAMTKHKAYYADRPADLLLDASFIPSATATAPVISATPTAPATPAEPRTSLGLVHPHQDNYYAGYRRKPYKCAVVADDRDNKGRVMRLVVATGLLFRHTDEDLRPYFREEDLLTCYGQLSQVGDNIYLSFEFNIASPNAQKNFGSLPEASLLRLTLINGSEIDLINLQGDAGRIDAYSGNTVFVGRYLIEKEDQRSLSKTELNSMRVVWSTGYEDYDIFAVDFLINQFECLEANQ